MLFSIYVGVAQLVERRTHKPQVTGSIPVADTLNVLKIYDFMYNRLDASSIFLGRKRRVFIKYLKMRL